MLSTKIRHKFCLLTVIGILLSSILLVQDVSRAFADTTFPEEFRGSVTVNGALAAVGAKIIAKISGVERGNFIITEAGKYGGSGTFGERLVVAGNEADVSQTVTFWISGTQASQTAVYEPGESKELDLSVSHSYTYPLSASNNWISNALNYLRNSQIANGSIHSLGTSAWAVMAISAAGEDPTNWKVGSNSIIDYLEDNVDDLGDIATDWARAILAISAAGENPWDFGGVDHVTKLKTYHDGNQFGSATMLNDDFWSILALISVSEEQSSEYITDSVAFIKEKQNTDHGWSYVVGGASDVDNTAAAVMALIAAGESSSSEVITNALAYLRAQQQSDGGFLSHGVSNAAADAWAICAIKAAGQNPTGSNWTKNSNNPVGHLLSLQIADGSFNWKASTSSNPEWMTSYTIPALLGKPYPVATVEAPSSDGSDGGTGAGDGGGGGGSVAGLTPVLNSVTSQGRFTEDVTAKSEDGKIELHIPKNTIGKNKAGGILSSIRIKEEKDPPDPPEKSNVIGNVYDFGPEGATFDPPISLTVEYRESKIPDGVAEENLVLAYWDEEAEEWVELEGTVDPKNNTITAKISHFTNFTILAHTRSASFTATDLVIAPDEIEIGGTVSLSAIVTNTGDLTDTHEVTLKVNGAEVEVKEVEVIGGDSERVSFSITGDTVGTYMVDIDRLSGSFVVKEKVESLTTPPPIPPAITSPAKPSAEPKLPPAPESSQAEQPLTEPSPTPPLPPLPSEEPTNWLMVGGIIAGVVVFGLLIFFLIRRFLYYYY